MDRAYWERIAPKYNKEIFDVLKNDRSGKIVEAIRKFGGRRKTVIDMGCAIGKWIPLLASCYRQVTATDISSKNLEIARQRCRQFSNVEYIRMDMSAKNLTVTPCDVGVCINAILTDSLQKRIHFFQSLYLSVVKGGHLILVVPSLESKLYTQIIANRWNIDGDHKERIPSAKKAYSLARNIRQGVTDIDQVPTKHYLREELELLLQLEKFKVIAVDKINYPWKTEFHHAPKWLKEPLPWDWLCIAKRL